MEILESWNTCNYFTVIAAILLYTNLGLNVLRSNLISLI